MGRQRVQHDERIIPEFGRHERVRLEGKIIMSMDFKSQLKSALSTEHMRLLHLIRDEATQRGQPLYIVGGSVRDLVFGRVVNDFDLTVEGDAIGLARSLASKHGGKVTVHTKFGTAKWFLPDNLKTDQVALDLISARSEMYKYSAALPTVKLGTIKD